MDVNGIFNAGGVLVPNPNYSKSKKNTQPKYIIASDLDHSVNPTGNAMADVMYDATAKGNQRIIGDEKDLAKYNDYGITPTVETLPTLDKELADAQSNWEKAFNSLGQTLGSELVLGTFKGFSDLFDFVTSNIFHITEDDYQNPVSETLEKWQNYFNEELMPIYSDPSLNIQNGGVKDFGWWAKNLPNVASSLTLLIPGAGVTKGLSMLGKVSRVGKGISKARRWATMVEKVTDYKNLNNVQLSVNSLKGIARANLAAENLTEAMLMRTMENYQEARDVHTQTYQTAVDALTKMKDTQFQQWVEQNKDMFDDDVDLSNRDAVAKAVAKKAADRTFTMDFSNIIFDVIQLHSLKNVGNGIKKATGRAVNEFQKKSLAKAEEFATGVAKEQAKKPLYKTVGGAIADFTKFNALTILEESTEGIEEAVNYIAQQEGITYGKLLLDGSATDYRKTKGIASYLTLGIPNIIGTYTNMQGDIVDYAKTAELQESAFWGVMGGWLFGAGHEAFNKASLAINRKAEQERRKENSTTGESIEDSNGWFDMLMSPMTKAAKVAIENRQRRLAQLSADLKNIKDGIDIFGKPVDGKLPSFEGNVEMQQALARQRVIDEYMNSIVIDAMNSGTYELMLEYFKSDEVKKAMVKAGVISESEINDYTQQVVNKLESVKDLYARQSTYILNQLAALNAAKDYDQTIPLEYAQIIATENAQRILSIQSVDRQIANIGTLITDHENDTRQSNPDILFEEDKNTVKIATLIDMYSRLTAQSKLLDEKIKEQGSKGWRLRLEKNRINSQKENILKQLKESTYNGAYAGIAAVLNATKYANSYVANPDGTFSQDDTIFERADEDILKELNLDMFHDKKYNQYSDETILQTAKVMRQNFQRIQGSEGLANLNQNLFSEYITLAELENQKSLQQSLIANSQTQIQERVDWLNNSKNEARGKLLDKAEEIVTKAILQYDGVADENGNNILDIIYKMYMKDKASARQIAESFMSNVEGNDSVTAAQFIDALDIFNFTSQSNEGIYAMLNEMFEEVRRAQRQSRAKDNNETDTTESENSTTSENAISEGENLSPSTTSSDSVESTIAQISGQISSADNANTPQQNQNHKPKRNIKFIINGKGEIIAIKNSNTSKGINAVAIENGDGTLSIDITNVPKRDQLRLIAGGLYNGEVDLLDTNGEWEISEAPIIKPKGNGYVLISSGEIVATKFNNKLEAKYQQFLELTSQDASFAEDVQNNPNNAIETVKSLLDVSDDAATEIVKRYQYETQSGTSSPVEEMSNPFDVTNLNNETPTAAPTEDNGTEGSNNGTDLATTIPSTGELTTESPTNEGATNSTTPDTTVATPAVAPANDNKLPAPASSAYDIDTIKRGIAQTFGKYIPNIQDENINFDDVAAKVEAELLPNASKIGLTEEQLKQEIASQLNLLKDAHNKLMTLKTSLAKSGANLTYAARYEEPDTTDFSIFFKKAVEAFMQEYEKIIVMPKVDGKLVVRLEDILRICNNVYATSDTSVARQMYGVVYNYLNSPEGKAKYITLDLQNGQQALNNITKTAQQIQQEADNSINKFRVNISDFISFANEQDDAFKENYFKALDSINVGDKLEMVSTPTEIVFRKGEIVIGNMPKPRLVDNKYIITNSGWVTDVRLGQNGDVVSESKDIIEHIFLDESPSNDKLREIIIKAGLLNLNDKKDRDAFNQLAKTVFANHPIIEKLVNEAKADAKNRNNKLYVDYKKGTVDYDRILLYLTKLWNYSTLSTNASDKQSNKLIIKTNLNSWFKKLYDTYDTVARIDSRGEVDVVEVTEGQVIRLMDDTRAGYDDLLLAQDALADSTDARISITDMQDNTVLNVSGKPNQKLTSFSSSSTMLAVFSRNKEADFVKAWGVKLNDFTAMQSNSEIKAIRAACYQTVYETFERFVSNKAFGNMAEVEDLIRSIIDVKNNNDRIALFRAVFGNCTIEEISKPGSNERGITIHWSDGGSMHRRFRIYSNSNYGSTFGFYDDGTKQKAYLGKQNANTIAQEAAKAFMLFLQDIANVNISRIGIKADNVPNSSLKGFVTYKNGKLSVNIPSDSKYNYTKEFDSYNDFLIKGNLVRVNTKKGENGSNFEKRGKNQRANQNLYVSLPTPTIPSSTTNVSSDDIEKTSDAAVFESVKNETINNKTNAGLAIFSQILGEDAVARFTEVATEFNVLDDILPSRIMYDPEYNGRINGKVTGHIAESHGNGRNVMYHRYKSGTRKTARIPVGENLVVGSRFLNMASSSSINKRREAIRKLIHEQIHIKLQADEQVRFNTLYAVNDIYDEFNRLVTEDIAKLDKSSEKYKIAKYCKDLFANYKGDRLLEEFMVESLTNNTLFHYLNSKTYDDVTNNKKDDNLFTRIAKAIAEFFEWDIKDNSLYMKELNVLRDLVSRDSTDTLADISVEARTEEEINAESEVETQQESEATTEVPEETPSEEETESETSEDEEEGFDLDDYEFDDSEDSMTSSQEELEDYNSNMYATSMEELDAAEGFVFDAPDKDGFRKVVSLEAFSHRLPIDLKPKFDAIAESGGVETKCS